MSGYNGWSNFETWSIFCHFQPETKQEVDFAKACFADAYEELPDFIRPLIDSSKINWGEIYTAVYDADNDDEQHEPTTPTIMICNNFEWIRENCGVDFDGLDDDAIRELVDLLTQDLSELLTLSGFQVEFPSDGKSTYHGWNGFCGFKHQFGICGTFDPLNDEQYDKVGELVEDSRDMVELITDRIRRTSFAFKTDSESGTLTANSFADACQQLRDMYPQEILGDGGWGWVEDHDGQRFVVGEIP